MKDLKIRQVANGFIAFECPSCDGAMGNEHVFTCPRALGDWVAKQYGWKSPEQAQVQQALETALSTATIVDDATHNPDELTNEQIGVKEGWRLITIDEFKNKNSAKYRTHTQYWAGYGWRDPYPDNTRFGDSNTYRTKLSREELAKLP
jgi:hypothetical protein